MVVYVHVLVGAPGAGKSTVAEKITEGRNASSAIISSDAIRKELYGDESIQGDSRQVFGIYYKRMIEAIDSGKLVVVMDATNLTKKNRQEYIWRIRKRYSCTDVFIYADYVRTDLDTCLKRNASRSRVVPEPVVRRMYCKCQAPSVDEGFDRVVEWW